MLSNPGGNLAQQKGVGIVAPLLCNDVLRGLFLESPSFDAELASGKATPRC
jgi:hypothetical protein